MRWLPSAVLVASIAEICSSESLHEEATASTRASREKTDGAAVSDTMEERSLGQVGAVLMGDDFGAELGVPQILQPYDEVLQVIESARNYMLDFVDRDTDYTAARNVCRNLHPKCGMWAVNGGANPIPICLTQISPLSHS